MKFNKVVVNITKTMETTSATWIVVERPSADEVKTQLIRKCVQYCTKIYFSLFNFTLMT